LNLKASKIYSF